MSIPPLPGQPCGEEGPVFRAPWEAQVFALAVALNERGLFTWSEWADRLAKAIKAAQAAGDQDTGETYYSHWLAALETLAVEKGAATLAELIERKDAWDRAAHATPHGQPIVLGAEKARQHHEPR